MSKASNTPSVPEYISPVQKVLELQAEVELLKRALAEVVRTSYLKDPVDALLSDLRGTFVPVFSDAGMLAIGEFEERVAVFNHEIATDEGISGSGQVGC